MSGTATGAGPVAAGRHVFVLVDDASRAMMLGLRRPAVEMLAKQERRVMNRDMIGAAMSKTRRELRRPSCRPGGIYVIERFISLSHKFNQMHRPCSLWIEANFNFE